MEDSLPEKFLLLLVQRNGAQALVALVHAERHLVGGGFLLVTRRDVRVYFILFYCRLHHFRTKQVVVATPRQYFGTER